MHGVSVNDEVVVRGVGEHAGAEGQARTISTWEVPGHTLAQGRLVSRCDLPAWWRRHHVRHGSCIVAVVGMRLLSKICLGQGVGGGGFDIQR